MMHSAKFYKPAREEDEWVQFESDILWDYLEGRLDYADVFCPDYGQSAFAGHDDLVFWFMDNYMRPGQGVDGAVLRLVFSVTPEGLSNFRIERQAICLYGEWFEL